MSEELQRPAPDERERVDQSIDPARDQRTIGGPEQPDRVGPETDVPTRDEPLAREGTDAPDAADIEDPERQL
jgi:hypothetical protein